MQSRVYNEIDLFKKNIELFSWMHNLFGIHSVLEKSWRIATTYFKSRGGLPLLILKVVADCHYLF
jgi:hypothetical protein